MSMSDPISDMLTRIRNGQAARKKSVEMSSSTFKLSVLKVLKEEGYISDYVCGDDCGKATVQVELKYYKGQPVIDKISRVSRPGLRKFTSKNDIPTVMGGFGVAIISTSKGVVTDKVARSLGQGGEVICTVQ